MPPMRRTLLVVALVLAAAVAAGWRWQTALAGASARWYLGRVAAREQSTGDLTQRRAVVARVSRTLLLPPPPDGMVAELFELITQMSDRTARGEISFAWFAYLYTSYARDLARDRPDGTPARAPAEVRTALDQTIAFYAIRKRPDAPGVTVADVLGGGGESYTLEQIDQAAREGKTLPLR